MWSDKCSQNKTKNDTIGRLYHRANRRHIVYSVELEEAFEAVNACTGKNANNPQTWIANAVENDPWYRERRDEVTAKMASMIDQERKTQAVDDVIEKMKVDLELIVLVKVLKDLIIWKADARKGRHAKRIDAAVALADTAFQKFEAIEQGTADADAASDLPLFQSLADVMMQHRPEETKWCHRNIQAKKVSTTVGAARVKQDVTDKADACAASPTCPVKRGALGQVSGLVQGIDLSAQAAALQAAAHRILNHFKGDVPEAEKDACTEHLETFQQLCTSAGLFKEAATMRLLLKAQQANFLLRELQSLASTPEEIRLHAQGRPKLEALRAYMAELNRLVGEYDELGTDVVPGVVDAQVAKDIASYLEIFVTLDVDEADEKMVTLSKDLAENAGCDASTFQIVWSVDAPTMDVLVEKSKVLKPGNLKKQAEQFREAPYNHTSVRPSVLFLTFHVF